MGNVKELLNNMKQLTPQRMERLLLLAVKQNEKILTDVNRKNLMDGLTSIGSPVDLSYASMAYAEFKMRLNPKGVVDLKLTGAFHNSIFLNADNFPILFKASDRKAPDLLLKYGEEILGIPKLDLEYVVRNMVLPDFQNLIKGNLRIR